MALLTVRLPQMGFVPLPLELPQVADQDFRLEPRQPNRRHNILHVANRRCRYNHQSILWAASHVFTLLNTVCSLNQPVFVFPLHLSNDLLSRLCERKWEKDQRFSSIVQESFMKPSLLHDLLVSSLRILLVILRNADHLRYRDRVQLSEDLLQSKVSTLGSSFDP